MMVIQLAVYRGLHESRKEIITPRCPQQNCMVERVLRTLKEQCVYRWRFASIQHAPRAIRDRISLCNHRRPHRALDMRTPAAAFALAPLPEQIALVRCGSADHFVCGIDKRQLGARPTTLDLSARSAKVGKPGTCRASARRVETGRKLREVNDSSCERHLALLAG